MTIMVYNALALTDFERSGFAVVNGGWQYRASQLGSRAEVSKKTVHQTNSAYFDVQTASKLRGFFYGCRQGASANYRTSGEPRTDNRNHLGIGRACDVVSQDASKARVTGVNLQDMGFVMRAVADTDLSDLAMKLNDGTGQKNGMLVRVNPKSLH